MFNFKTDNQISFKKKANSSCVKVSSLLTLPNWSTQKPRKKILCQQKKVQYCFLEVHLSFLNCHDIFFKFSDRARETELDKGSVAFSQLFNGRSGGYKTCISNFLNIAIHSFNSCRSSLSLVSILEYDFSEKTINIAKEMRHFMSTCRPSDINSPIFISA